MSKFYANWSPLSFQVNCPIGPLNYCNSSALNPISPCFSLAFLFYAFITSI